MCTGNNHIVGDIARESVRFSEWEQAVAAFEKVVDDFNIRGQRDEIPHPGWCVVCKFCPECGASLADLVIRPPNWNS